MFTRRKVRPRLLRFLYNQLDNPNLAMDAKAAIADALDDDDILEELTANVTSRAVSDGAPPLARRFSADGDHPFLDWLKQNLPYIITLIFTLLGLPVPPLPTPPSI